MDFHQSSPRTVHAVSPVYFSPASPLTRFETRFPSPVIDQSTPLRKQKVSPQVNQKNTSPYFGKNHLSPEVIREPLKPIKRTPDNQLKVVRHRDKEVVASSVEVDRMYELLEKHHYELQKISRQIEQLLQIKSDEETYSPVKPKTTSVETMTSIDSKEKPPSIQLTPNRKQTVSPGRKTLGIMTKASITTTLCLDEVEAERRNCHESQDTFYQKMIRNVNDILFIDSDSEETLDEKTTKRNTVSSSGSETIYIKKLASKYLSEKTIAFRGGKNLSSMEEDDIRRVNRRILKREDKLPVAPTSFATKNYLEKYGLTTKRIFPETKDKGKNQVLDLDKIRQQPKFL